MKNGINLPDAIQKVISERVNCRKILSWQWCGSHSFCVGFCISIPQLILLNFSRQNSQMSTLLYRYILDLATISFLEKPLSYEPFITGKGMKQLSYFLDIDVNLEMSKKSPPQIVTALYFRSTITKREKSGQKKNKNAGKAVAFFRMYPPLLYQPDALQRRLTIAG